MALLSKPGLIPLRIENGGNLITTQVNKINFVGAVTGSIGNFNDVTIQIGLAPSASYAFFAVSSSYSLTSTSASYASASTSASYAATASFVAGGASGFPYTGSAQITGSLGITGSFSQSGSANLFLQGLINQTTATTHVVTFNNATGQLFITASSAFGGGGGGGTPGGATNTIQFNNAGTFSGSGNFTIIGGNFVYLTGSLLVTGSSQFLGPVTGSSFTGSFTGSLFGTSSWAVSASRAISSSYTFNATSASYASTSSYSQNLIISGSINNVNYIDFNTASAVPAWKSGRVFWDNTDGALSVYNFEQDITLQIGQENWTRVSNRTGATILNGTVVRLKGAHGDAPEVELAQSLLVSGSVNLQNQILGVATHDIEDNSKGFITTQGLVRGLNTSAFNDGDTLFVGTGSAGVLTNIAPPAPYEIIPVGVCVKASPGTSGIIYVAVQEPIDFSDLSSVLVTGSYSYGDIWTYIRSGSTGVWSHTNQLSGSYGLTGSLNTTGSIISTFITASSFTGSFTGSLFGTSSWSNNSLTASLAPLYTLVSATSSMLAPYLLTSRTSSFATTGSNTFIGNQTISGSINSTGSLNLVGPITQSNGGNSLSSYQEIIYSPGGVAGGGIPTTVITKTGGNPMSMFIEYQLINTITLTDQRSGYIMANFNSSGTPTSTFTETVTADIGNTSMVTFTTNGSPNYDIVATNGGATSYTFKAILRYF